MGYSIACRVKNPKLRDRMLKFMGKNFRPWSVVIGKGETVSSGEPTDDLSYDSAKKALGFDYASHCHGWESCHIYSLTRWMAIKVGERKTKFSKDNVEPNVFKDPVPFMVYDGYESWPILIVPSVTAAMKLPRKNRWCATDKYGVYIAPEVNHILTHFAEDAFFDPKLSERMFKDYAKLGERPDYKKDKAGYDAWMDAREAVKVKHTRPEVDKMLPVVRAEVKRLDKLWEAQA